MDGKQIAKEIYNWAKENDVYHGEFNTMFVSELVDRLEDVICESCKGTGYEHTMGFHDYMSLCNYCGGKGKA